jgi:precorrin-6Y C5,15-methyltransferase (decarboxylating)
VFAVEKNAARIKQIERNIATFGAVNISTVHGVLPDVLESLPPPDRVFIGGGGRHLTAIIKVALGLLKPDGVLVINTVLLSNLTAALDCLSASGWRTEVAQLQVCRTKKMPYDQRFSAQNPVWIIRAEKEEEDAHV